MTVYVEDRIGSVVIGDETIYFTQRGYDLSISPQVAEVGSNAGAGQIGVTANLQQTWEAISLSPWITISGGNSGNGSGIVRYSVTENNTGASRTGKIIVSGEEYEITQTTSLIMNVYNEDGGGTVTGSGNYDTLSSATLSAIPSVGYMFSHWSGDAVGSDNPLSVSMDSSKDVEGHFVEISTADSIVFNSRDRLNLYTLDQIGPENISDVDVDDTLISKTDSSDTFNITFGLRSNTSLRSNDWSNIDIDSNDVTIENGKVSVDVEAPDTILFYRVDGGGE